MLPKLTTFAKAILRKYDVFEISKSCITDTVGGSEFDTSVGTGEKIIRYKIILVILSKIILLRNC